jgi:hypothetical protein
MAGARREKKSGMGANDKKVLGMLMRDGGKT